MNFFKKIFLVFILIFSCIPVIFKSVCEEINIPINITYNIVKKNNKNIITFILDENTDFQKNDSTNDYNILEIKDLEKNYILDSLSYEIENKSNYNFLIKYKTKENIELSKNLNIYNYNVSDDSSISKQQRNELIIEQKNIYDGMWEYYIGSDKRAHITKWVGTEKTALFPGNIDGYEVILDNNVFKNSSTTANLREVICVDNVYAPENMDNFFSNLPQVKIIKLTGMNFQNTRSVVGMFENCMQLNQVVIWNLNCPLTSYSKMFKGCRFLSSVDMSYGINSSSVTDVSYMFADCSLTDFNFLNNLNLANVRNFSHMFENNYSVTDINLNFSTSSAKDMSYMFYNCKNLKNIDISNFWVNNVTNMSKMFYNCNNITVLNFSNWLFNDNVNLYQMFDNMGRILIIANNQITISKLQKEFDSANKKGVVSTLEICFNNIQSNNYFKKAVYTSDEYNTMVSTQNIINYANTLQTNLEWINQNNSENLKDLNSQKILEYGKRGNDYNPNKKETIYTINFYNKNNLIATKKFNVGEKIKSGYSIANGDYGFIGWNLNPDGLGLRIIEGQELTQNLFSSGEINLYYISIPYVLSIDEINHELILKQYKKSDSIIEIPQFFDVLPNYQVIIDPINNFKYSSVKTISFLGKVYGRNNFTRFFYQISDINNLENLDTSQVTNMSYMFSGVNLNDLNISVLNTSQVTNMSYMFFQSRINNNFVLEGIDTSQVTNMSYMFASFSVKNFDISILNTLNTSQVTNMSYMFQSCYISSDYVLEGIDTSQVTDMSYMFAYSDFRSVEINLDTSNLVDMKYMFYNYDGIIKFKKINTSKVTNMTSLFSYTKNTIDLSGFDTSQVTNMSHMFYYTKWRKIDVSSFDTSNVINMASMFANTIFDEIDLSHFDTSNVTNMSGMFSNAAAIELNLSNFNTSQVTNMRYLFDYCPNLKKINISSWTAENLSDMRAMFRGCKNLLLLDMRNFNVGTNVNMEYTFGALSKLIIISPKEYVQNIVPLTLTFEGQNNYFKKVFYTYDEYVQIDDINNLRAYAQNFGPNWENQRTRVLLKNETKAPVEIAGKTGVNYILKPLVKYTITYYSNGGNGIINPQTFEENTKVILSSNTFTKDGYKQVGWNTQSDGNGTSYNLGQEITITQNLDLYAKWQVNIYTIEFNGNGGNFGANQTTYQQVFTIDSLGMFERNKFIYEGFVIDSWNTQADGSGKSYDLRSVASLEMFENSENKTLNLFAIWRKQEGNELIPSNPEYAILIPKGIEFTNNNLNINEEIKIYGINGYELTDYSQLQINVNVTSKNNYNLIHDNNDGNVTIDEKVSYQVMNQNKILTNTDNMLVDSLGVGGTSTNVINLKFSINSDVSVNNFIKKGRYEDVLTFNFNEVLNVKN